MASHSTPFFKSTFVQHGQYVVHSLRSTSPETVFQLLHRLGRDLIQSFLAEDGNQVHLADRFLRRNAARFLSVGSWFGDAPYPNEVTERIHRDDIPTTMGDYDEAVGFDSVRVDCRRRGAEPAARMLGDCHQEKSGSALRSEPVRTF